MGDFDMEWKSPYSFALSTSDKAQKYTISRANHYDFSGEQVYPRTPPVKKLSEIYPESYLLKIVEEELAQAKEEIEQLKKELEDAKKSN